MKRLFVLLPLFFITWLAYGRPFITQDNALYDFVLQMRPTQKISKDIVIIEVDDNTLHHLGQWPLPRDFHASLVDILHELGAKVIVFDVIFSESTQYDETFAQSIKENGHVYLPEVFDFPENVSAYKILDHSSAILAPLSTTLSQAVPGQGHINVFVDPDGKIRRIPLYVRDPKGLVPQLSLQAACDFLGVNCLNVRFGQSVVTIDNKLKIPVVLQNEFLINYPGRWKDSFIHFSYVEIIALYKDMVTGQSGPGRLAELKGKACFIGLTAAGTVDLGASTLETNYPMVGLNASLFNSVIENKHLFRASSLFNTTTALIIYAISLWISFAFAPLKSLIGNLLFAGLFFGLGVFNLHYYGMWMEMYLPLLVILCVYVVCAVLRWTREMYKRENLEKDMRLAQKIQMQFLQGLKKETQDFDLAVWFRPARYVSGDFYDVDQKGQKASIFMGDVSGKGLSAALCMAQGISLLRIFSQQDHEPDMLLHQLNTELCLRNSERFITALYTIVDTKTGNVKASSAGHGAFFVYRAQTKRFEDVVFSPRTPLGIREKTTYEQKNLTIKPGDKLLFLSDGATEARTPQGKELGLSKIKQCFIDNAANSNKKILESLTALITHYAQDGLDHDDITIIIFSLKS